MLKPADLAALSARQLLSSKHVPNPMPLLCLNCHWVAILNRKLAHRFLVYLWGVTAPRSFDVSEAKLTTCLDQR